LGEALVLAHHVAQRVDAGWLDLWVGRAEITATLAVGVLVEVEGDGVADEAVLDEHLGQLVGRGGVVSQLDDSLRELGAHLEAVASPADGADLADCAFGAMEEDLVEVMAGEERTQVVALLDEVLSWDALGRVVLARVVLAGEPGAVLGLELAQGDGVVG